MANTYLQRTPSGAGNRKTWTFSAWVKRANLVDGRLTSCYAAGNETDNIDILFHSNAIKIVGWNTAYRTTNRLFRDTSAWYHIVVAVDTTQGIANDRIKIYVNGVQETSFADTNNPSQNADIGYNQAATTRIGSASNAAGGYFDGLMSHVNFSDGYALAPTVFGSTDSVTGEWKINTSPSVTYGTNGFFILKDGNSVTDQSGEGNDFTVGGGTLTKTEDNPSNVFATGNPLGSKSITFSNGNNTVTNPTASPLNTAIATLGASSGKYYAEFKATSVGPGTYDVYTGFVNLDKTNLQNASTLGETTDGAGISSGGGYIYYNGLQFAGPTTATTNGDIVNLAMDLDNGRLYWGINGTYVNSGNPASGSTGTGGMPIANITAGGTYTFAVGIKNGATINLNFGNGYFGTTAVASAGTNASGNGIFEYDVPTGYTALSTKGLNL